MKIATLPDFFRFHSAGDLVRMGRNNDGGYLVSKSDIKASDLLIGLGINNDWSFERDFVLEKNVPVVAYDASISRQVFFLQVVESILWCKPRLTLKRLQTYFSYNNFFGTHRQHVAKFVGIGDQHVSMSEVLSKVEATNIFLKIDIEGSEYRLLDELVQYQNRISGLVIEFHDCDLHLDRIASFIDRLSLPIVHVHANNFAPLTEPNGLPFVLEVTFSRFAELSDNCLLPHPRDQPNSAYEEEIALRFAQ